MSGVIWFTGLSGAGKTTLAEQLKKQLLEKHIPTILLDGDELRSGLSSDLGFSIEDRKENARRLRELAKLLAKKSFWVLVSSIAPFEKERQFARATIAPTPFIEVYCDCPLEVCEERDPKGLYKKVRAGEIKSFTGISSPYEAPEEPDVHLHTDQLNANQCIENITLFLAKMGLISYPMQKKA